VGIVGIVTFFVPILIRIVWHVYNMGKSTTLVCRRCVRDCVYVCVCRRRRCDRILHSSCLVLCLLVSFLSSFLTLFCNLVRCSYCPGDASCYNSPNYFEGLDEELNQFFACSAADDFFSPPLQLPQRSTTIDDVCRPSEYFFRYVTVVVVIVVVVVLRLIYPNKNKRGSGNHKHE
jgi:hypothetical protein